MKTVEYMGAGSQKGGEERTGGEEGGNLLLVFKINKLLKEIFVVKQNTIKYTYSNNDAIIIVII